MPLLVILLLLVLLSGGAGFGGFVTGSLALVVQVLFAFLVIGLILQLFRGWGGWYGPGPGGPTL
jgi:hypothetical protein